MVGLPSAERAGTFKANEKVNLLHIVAKFGHARIKQRAERRFYEII